MEGSTAALYLAILACFAALTGGIAYAKGENFFLFALGGCLLFIVFLPIVLFMKPNQAALASREIKAGRAKQCPWCMNLIHPQASVCPYCNQWVVQQPPHYPLY